MSLLNQYILNHDVSINITETIDTQIEVETGDCIKSELITYCRNPWGKTIEFGICNNCMDEALISVECESEKRFQVRVNGEFIGYFENANQIYNHIESNIESFY